MNTREAAEKASLSYGQVRYLLDNGVIKHRAVKGGEARDLSARDVWVLKMAAAMRTAGIGIEIIQDVADVVNYRSPSEPVLLTNDMPPFWVYWNGKTWQAATVPTLGIKYYEDYRELINAD